MSEYRYDGIKLMASGLKFQGEGIGVMVSG